ncbi:MAG: HipA domain-containing protein [Lachnospiraceae bacterium]|nr:HipA domain-containing protein [Lachnospiraceae bacterium]
MKDFSFWVEYEGNCEGSGRSEKIWLINPDTRQVGLFKYKKDELTTDHVSECLAYQLANIIGIPCAKFELGTYMGREGSMSYNIIQNPNELLIEGINYINNAYPKYDPEKFRDMGSGEVYSIQMIEKALEKTFLFKEFLKIPVFDYLIGNTDRHQSNWAVIWDGKKLRISPLYDNSSSLCAYISEKQVAGYLGNDLNRWSSLVERKSRSIIRRTVEEQKQPTHLEMLKYIKNNYYSETEGLVEKIIAVVTEDRISDILNVYVENELSEKKKIIIKKFLLHKVSEMKNVYFGEEE